MTGPPAPAASFASDNAAGVHPVVMDALVEANVGPALAYGADRLTEAAIEDLRSCFEAPVEVLWCWGGTGANVVALSTLLQPWQAVVAVADAHVVVDEAGGPTRFSGSALLTVPAVDGKLVPDALERYRHWSGVEHHPQPRVVTVSQVTESGTVYSVDELGALADRCHALGLLLHVDGARIANAVVATGARPRELLVDTGVDAVTFGMTKNGAMFGEAVVFCDPSLAGPARYVRKQAGQLVSKHRFVAAQCSALLRDDLWLANATTANAMAARLADAVGDVPAVDVVRAPEANSVFARIPWDRLAELQAWSFFWPWDPAERTVRWMAGFATTDDDVDTFAAGLRQLLAAAT